MALIALATANSIIGPREYADMAQALAPRFLVDTPTAIQPSYHSGTVTLQPGSCLIAGTRVHVTSVEKVDVPEVSTGLKDYAIVIRVDWEGGQKAAQLVCLPSTKINESTIPYAQMINRTPGVMYDAVVATVTRKAGQSPHAGFTDYRMWGGDGGPLRVSDAALLDPSLLDARVGTHITTDRGRYTKRLDGDGVWRIVGSDKSPWKAWTPTLRYYGDSYPNGKGGGDPVKLGNGGWSAGRYRVVDGMLDAFIDISPGASGADFGSGPMTIDMPVPVANWSLETWSQGHLFTTGYGADGSYDWHMEMVLKRGWQRGLLYAPSHESSAVRRPYMAQGTTTHGAGTGTPRVRNGYPIGPMYIHANYPIDE